MGHWGKIACGTVGFFLGGPAGAVAGVALGAAVDAASTDDEPAKEAVRSSAQQPAESLEGAAQRRHQAWLAQSKTQAFLDYRRRAVESFEKDHDLHVHAEAALDDATVAVPGGLNEAVAQAVAARYAARTTDFEARKERIAEALRAVGEGA
jgi:hypothetical protein